MELDRRTSLMALAALPGIGPVNLYRLDKAMRGKVEHLLEMDAAQRASWCNERVVTELEKWKRYFDPQRVITALQRMDADFVTFEEDGYPRKLLPYADRPVGLYRYRRHAASAERAIAIVGTRRPSSYGRRIARDFATQLAGKGYQIISGLAEGIDTEAHRAALTAGGLTLAVLGGGLNRCYPASNRSLMEAISRSGGAWTEFPLWRSADRRSFPQRNRIVAGMADAVVVIESGATGGSLITARFGNELGKPVYVVPGRIDAPESEGCHQLIRDGAQLVTSIGDILTDLNYLPGFLREAQTRPTTLKAPTRQRPRLSGAEERIWDHLIACDAARVDQIAEALKLPVSALSGHLVGMEMEGLIIRRLDGYFELA